MCYWEEHSIVKNSLLSILDQGAQGVSIFSTGDVIISHLFQVVSDGFFHCKATVFLFVIKNILEEIL
jgi:hypothetical protein